MALRKLDPIWFGSAKWIERSSDDGHLFVLPIPSGRPIEVEACHLLCAIPPFELEGPN